MITLQTSHLDEIFAHAREADPSECCGLLSGGEDGRAKNIYQLRNVASDAHVAYEAAPEQLFSAQRQMRECGEQLLAIYHSHPRATNPEPSATDVRLAYYPSATYLIIGLGGRQPVMRAFRILEHDHHWEEVEYAVADE